VLNLALLESFIYFCFLEESWTEREASI